MEVGVFIPIGNNGWLISTTSPQYMPTCDLNREVSRRPSATTSFRPVDDQIARLWRPVAILGPQPGILHPDGRPRGGDRRIQLFATVAVLTVPPPFTARMAVTIDSISPGRFGINIISGSQQAEYTQMGLWPGAEHYRRRYEYCAEYVAIMREFWETGRSDLHGEFFQMDDCRVSPLPIARIQIIGAAQSDADTRFAAEFCDYNFCASDGSEPADPARPRASPASSPPTPRRAAMSARCC